MAKIITSRPWLFGVVLVFLSAVVLVTGIDSVQMRPDESLVYDFTRNDLPYLVRYLAAEDSHPPLWFSSFWLWRQFVGDSEFAGRLLALFYSLLALALVYQVGRRWFGTPRYGLLAMALLGVNAFFFIHALEIRPYGLILLLVTASMWTYQRWLTKQTGRAAFWYALTLGAMLYVHYFLFVLMLVQGLYFLLRRPSRRLLAQGLHVVVMAGLIWLPWLPFAIFQVLHVRQAETIGGNQRGLLGAGSTTIPSSPDAALDLFALASNGQIALYAALLVVGVVFLWRKSAYRLALAWAFGVPLVSLLINLAIAVYLPRYVVYMVIGFALVMAAGLAVLPGRVRWPAAAGVLVLSLVALPAQIPARTPYRDLFRQVSLEAQPQDVILFDSGGLYDGFVRGQVRRYLDPELWSRRVGSIEEAQTHRRVWYVTDGEWRADDTRARFARIEQSHPLQQVIGDCNRQWCYLLQLLEAPPWTEPAVFADSLVFLGMDVDAITDGSMTVRLWWTAESPISLDYSIGLHLLDDEGALVAQADGPITDFYSGQPVQTSTLEPDRLYIDLRVLDLSDDLPAGQYQPALVVYQSWDNTRLTLPGGVDQLLLEPLNLNAS